MQRHGHLEVRRACVLLLGHTGRTPDRPHSPDSAGPHRSEEEDRVFEDALAEYDPLGDERWAKVRCGPVAGSTRVRRTCLWAGGLAGGRLTFTLPDLGAVC